LLLLDYPLETQQQGCVDHLVWNGGARIE
jgi:hypothetical protein